MFDRLIAVEDAIWFVSVGFLLLVAAAFLLWWMLARMRVRMKIIEDELNVVAERRGEIIKRWEDGLSAANHSVADMNESLMALAQDVVRVEDKVEKAGQGILALAGKRFPPGGDRVAE